MAKKKESKKRSGFVLTVGDDDVVNADDSSSSEDEVVASTAKKKIKAKVKTNEFFEDFAFVNTVNEYNADPWANVMKYIKKPTGRITMEERIKRTIKDSKPSQVEEEYDNESQSEHDQDADSSDSNDETKLDNVKERQLKKRKKNTKLDLEERNLDDDTKEFFKDAPSFDHTLSFQEMNLSRPLLKAISAIHYVSPTPIQASTIPIALKGRDICGCAATGTGKTAAFMLPVLERLLYKPRAAANTKVLVLTPTRELAVQIFQVSTQLAQFSNIEFGLAAGGLDLKAQEAVLRGNPDVVIATPGRLIDHLRNTPSFNLRTIEVLILDEADRILDEYFQEQLKEIIKMCSPTRQTMLFSATMTEEVKELAAVSLKDPVKIFVNTNREVALNLRQEFIRVRPNHEGEREAILAAIICRQFNEGTLLFQQTRKQTQRMMILLGLLDVAAAQLHGGLTQTQRLDALKRFKEQQVGVLLATDLAARGLDIPSVKTVINFTMPPTVQHYVHRVGRTARAGKSGRAITLTGEKERRILREIIKQAPQPVKNRVVPQDVVLKYVEKLKKLEPELERLLREDKEEKEFAHTEMLEKKAQNMITYHDDIVNKPKRTWFQSKKEQFKEKQSQRLVEYDTKKKKGCKKGPKPPDTQDAKVEYELQKAMLYQARVAKRNKRPKKLNAMGEDAGRLKSKQTHPKKGGKGKSSFANELTNVSKKSVKKFRHGPSYQERMEAKGGKKPIMKRRR